MEEVVVEWTTVAGSRVRFRCGGMASTCGAPIGPPMFLPAAYRVCATDAAGNSACATP